MLPTQRLFLFATNSAFFFLWLQYQISGTAPDIEMKGVDEKRRFTLHIKVSTFKGNACTHLFEVKNKK